jgi:hypothetical protein
MALLERVKEIINHCQRSSIEKISQTSKSYNNEFENTQTLTVDLRTAVLLR